MTILRVEKFSEVRQEPRGPYSVKAAGTDQILPDSHYDRVANFGPYHLTNTDEIYNLFRKTPDKAVDYFFGFRTMEQLEEWFNEKDRELLKQYNFVIASYEVDEKFIAKSSRQVAFHYGKSKKIKEVKI